MTQEQIDKRIEDAKRAIEKCGQYINYRQDDIHSFEDIRKVCEPFLKQGYHAKINYFNDYRKPYQCYIIQKNKFDLSRQGMLIHSEILG